MQADLVALVRAHYAEVEAWTLKHSVCLLLWGGGWLMGKDGEGNGFTQCGVCHKRLTTRWLRANDGGWGLVSTETQEQAPARGPSPLFTITDEEFARERLGNWTPQEEPGG